MSRRVANRRPIFGLGSLPKRAAVRRTPHGQLRRFEIRYKDTDGALVGIHEVVIGSGGEVDERGNLLSRPWSSCGRTWKSKAAITNLTSISSELVVGNRFTRRRSVEIARSRLRRSRPGRPSWTHPPAGRGDEWLAKRLELVAVGAVAEFAFCFRLDLDAEPDRTFGDLVGGVRLIFASRAGNFVADLFDCESIAFGAGPGCLSR